MKSYYVNRILKFEFNEKSSRKRTISDDFFFQEIVFFWSGCCCHNPTPLLACLWDHLGLIDLPSGPLLLSCFNNFSLRKKKKRFHFNFRPLRVKCWTAPRSAGWRWAEPDAGQLATAGWAGPSRNTSVSTVNWKRDSVKLAIIWVI